MFLRKTERRKNGRTHLYWSVVESKRLDSGRVVQRHVLYHGEINASQAEAWRRAIEVFDEDAGAARSLSLFPEERCDLPGDDASVVRLRPSEMRLCRPRQWGACVGSPAFCSASCSSIASGPNACREAAKGRAGTTCCKRWRLIGSSRRTANGLAIDHDVVRRQGPHCLCDQGQLVGEVGAVSAP